MQSNRVVVIGAGTAGLSTALVLAARGLDVTVVERSSGPIRRGGLQGLQHRCEEDLRRAQGAFHLCACAEHDRAFAQLGFSGSDGD